MRSEKHAGMKLVFNDSISEILMSRYNTFNLYLMMDADIGGDAESIQRHQERMVLYIKNKEYDKLAKELENYSQNLSFIVNNISPKYLAFVALLDSIDGEPVTDITAEGATALLSRLGKVKYGFVENIVSQFKKKSDQEFDIMFPGLSPKGKMVEYYTLLKRRTILLLDSVINDTDRVSEIREIDEQITLLEPPRQYSGSEGVEAQHVRQYTELQVLLAMKANVDPKQLTALEFYQAIEILKDGK